MTSTILLDCVTSAEKDNPDCGTVVRVSYSPRTYRIKIKSFSPNMASMKELCTSGCSR